MTHAIKIRLAATAAIVLAIAAGGCSRGGAATTGGENISEKRAQSLLEMGPAAKSAGPPECGGYQTARVAEAPAVSAASNQVTIDNFSFTPQTLTVPVGTTVTWTNRDDVPHSATSTEKRFNSGLLDTDEKFSFTFTTAGDYPYFCGIHPHMTAKIVVR